MKIRESALLVLGSTMALSLGACSVSGDVSINVPSVATTSGATPTAAETTPIDKGNTLSDTTCIALSDLAMALGGEGYPVVNIDPNSDNLGSTIAPKAEDANTAILKSIEVKNEAGEVGYASDMASMDTLAATRVSDVAVQRTYKYLGGKTLLEVVDRKMKPKLNELTGLADQARAEVKRVMTDNCKDPAYPDPKSPFIR